MKKHLTKFSFMFPIILVMLLVMSFGLPCAAAQAITLTPIQPQCWAIIVGLEDYQYDVSWFDGVADAQSLSGALSPVLGSTHIKLLTGSQATKSNILSTIDSVGGQAATADTVLFFFSGWCTSTSLEPYDYSGSGDDISPAELSNAFAAYQAQKMVFIINYFERSSIRTAISGS